VKAIIIPEPLLDKAFDAVVKRTEVWKQISANKPDLLLEHFKLEINRLREELKNG
jgi:hypothetical protein